MEKSNLFERLQSLESDALDEVLDALNGMDGESVLFLNPFLVEKGAMNEYAVGITKARREDWTVLLRQGRASEVDVEKGWGWSREMPLIDDDLLANPWSVRDLINMYTEIKTKQ